MIAKDESFSVAMDALNQICRYCRTEKLLLHLHNVTGRVRRYYGKRADLRTEVTRIQSTPNFPKNKRSLPPDTHTYVCVSGGKKRSFLGKFGVLCILVTSVLRFALLPYY